MLGEPVLAHAEQTHDADHGLGYGLRWQRPLS